MHYLPEIWKGNSVASICVKTNIILPKCSTWNIETEILRQKEKVKCSNNARRGQGMRSWGELGTQVAGATGTAPGPCCGTGSPTSTLHAWITSLKRWITEPEFSQPRLVTFPLLGQGWGSSDQ